MLARLIIASAISGLIASIASAEPPSISTARPALTPGVTSRLLIEGKNLADVTGLWMSFEADVSLAEGVKRTADSVAFDVKLPPDAAVGVGVIRAVSTSGVSGVSTPALVFIDDLPTVIDNGRNATFESAQELSLPVAVEGVVSEVQSDYYRFAARAGESVSIEVVAQRIGSSTDPVIRLLDSSGRQLGYSDDEPGIVADCRLSHTFAADGEYFIELRDIRYGGGPRHHYRLRIGRFPLIAAPRPLFARIGGTTLVKFEGPAVMGVAATAISVPDAMRPGVMPIAARFADGDGSGFAMLGVTSTAVTLERESDDGKTTPIDITLPAAINGRFDAPADRDLYEFTATKGQRLLVTPYTESLGSPANVYMRLIGGDGKTIAEMSDPGLPEGQLTHTFKADGKYRLEVEDLHRRGGSQFVYHLNLSPSASPFSLSIEKETFAVPQGGEFEVEVTCERDGYDGPITLAVEGLGPHLTPKNDTIAKGKKSVKLKVIASSEAEVGHIFDARIVGRATVDGVEYEATADTLAAHRKLWPNLRYGALLLGDDIAISVTPAPPPKKEDDSEKKKSNEPKDKS